MHAKQHRGMDKKPLPTEGKNGEQQFMVGDYMTKQEQR